MANALDAGQRKTDEETFRALLRKLSAATSREQVAEYAQLGLLILLRKPGDRALHARLLAEVEATMAQIGPELPPDQLAVELRRAALRCTEILQLARQHHLAQSHPQPHPAAGSGHAASRPERRGPKPRAKARHRQPGVLVASLVVILLAAGGGLLAVSGLLHRGGSSASPSGLASQIQDAVHGAVAPMNLYGGPLKLSSVNGHLMVTVGGIPPAACIDTGWALMRKGTVAINGEAPRLVTAAKLTELCHQNEAGATLSWIPNQ